MSIDIKNIKLNPYNTNKENDQIKLSTAEYISDKCFLYCTVTENKNPEGFFVVNYSRKYHATNAMSAGFNKRGGAPRKDEILIGRYIDRTIRPLLGDVPLVVNISFLEVYDHSMSDNEYKAIATHVLGEVLKQYNYLEVAPTSHLIEEGVFSIYKNNLINCEFSCKGTSPEDLTNKIQQCVENSEEYDYQMDIRPCIQLLIKLYSEESQYKDVSFYDYFKDSALFNTEKISKRMLSDNLMHYCNVNNTYPSSGRNISNIKTYKYNNVSKNSLILRKGEEDHPNAKEVIVLGKIAIHSLESSQIVDHPIYSSKVTEPIMVNYFYNGHLQGDTGPLRVNRREIGHGMLAQGGFSKVLNINPADSVHFFAEILSGGGSTSMLTSTMIGIFSHQYKLTKNFTGGISYNSCYDSNNSLKIMADPDAMYDNLGYCDFKIIGNKNQITGAQLDVKRLDAVPIKHLLDFFTKFTKDLSLLEDQLDIKNLKLVNSTSLAAPHFSFDATKYTKIGLFIGKKGENINRLQQELKSKIVIKEHKDTFVINVFPEDKSQSEPSKELIAVLKGYGMNPKVLVYSKLKLSLNV